MLNTLYIHFCILVTWPEHGLLWLSKPFQKCRIRRACFLSSRAEYFVFNCTNITCLSWWPSSRVFPWSVFWMFLVSSVWILPPFVGYLRNFVNIPVWTDYYYHYSYYYCVYYHPCFLFLLLLLLISGLRFSLGSFSSELFHDKVRTCFLFIWSARVLVIDTVVICQNQLTIFIQARSTTIADYSGRNYLLETLVFLAKIGIISNICQGLKTQNGIFFRLFSLNTSHETISYRIIYLTYGHYIASVI